MAGAHAHIARQSLTIRRRRTNLVELLPLPDEAGQVSVGRELHDDAQVVAIQEGFVVAADVFVADRRQQPDLIDGVLPLGVRHLLNVCLLHTCGLSVSRCLMCGCWLRQVLCDAVWAPRVLFAAVATHMASFLHRTLIAYSLPSEKRFALYAVP